MRSTTLTEIALFPFPLFQQQQSQNHFPFIQRALPQVLFERETSQAVNQSFRHQIDCHEPIRSISAISSSPLVFDDISAFLDLSPSRILKGCHRPLFSKQQALACFQTTLFLPNTERQESLHHVEYKHER